MVMFASDEVENVGADRVGVLQVGTLAALWVTVEQTRLRVRELPINR